MTEQEAKLKMIEKLSQMINYLSSGDYGVGAIASMCFEVFDDYRDGGYDFKEKPE